MKRTDSQKRVWTYDDGEGVWSHGPNLIGCGANNGSKFQIWSGPNQDYYEFKTLKEAMAACQ